MSSTYNKDHYKVLPLYLRNELELAIQRYSSEPWFEEAWNLYRAKVLTLANVRLDTPALYFQKEAKSHEKVFSETQGVLH